MLHVLFGAVAGAVVGGGAVALSSVIRGKPIDWKSVGSAALGGAAVGAIGAATFGAGALAATSLTKTAGMVVAGASGGAIEQATDNVFHGRDIEEGVVEAAAIGGALGLVGGGARSLRKPLTRLARNKTVRRLARTGFSKLKNAGGRLLQRAKNSSAARALRRRARRTKVNLALGRRRTGRALRPVTEPVNAAAKRYVGDPFSRHVADPFRRRVADPLKRRVGDPLKRALAPFAARIGNTRAGQATKRLWGRYMNALDKNPVRTKALTSSSIAMTGDLIAQSTDDVEGIDFKRTAFRGGFGLLYSGPVGHHWFNALDRLVPGRGFKAMAGKVLLDQGIMTPISNTVFFTSFGMVVDGESPGEAFSTGVDDVKNVVPKGWAYWVPFHSVNFSKVPLNLRKPAADAAGLVWSVLFSRIAFENDDAEEPAATVGTTTTEAAPTVRVSNEREADLDGLIDVMGPLPSSYAPAEVCHPPRN